MPTHHFTPTHYFKTIAAHEPVLRVADGDTIITTTVDARGHDANSQRITPPGNPMTGPFYVEGAEPGDTLAVDLIRVDPSREWGWTAHALSANVVEPDFVRELPKVEGVADWRVDRAARTAILGKIDTSLGIFTLAIDPMIGCFGVAPAGGQAIDTATSAENGGNMDYRGFRAGMTAYFPVFVSGALFHLGDVHALQGHGEIVGTGIEISAEVEFILRVLKGKRSGWPRGENDTYIFTAGNARPLDQALQHATTEMVRWLGQDYGMDLLTASYFLGQTVEYEVGNVFDPAYTMICKLRKDLLAPYLKA